MGAFDERIALTFAHRHSCPSTATKSSRWSRRAACSCSTTAPIAQFAAPASYAAVWAGTEVYAALGAKGNASALTG